MNESSVDFTDEELADLSRLNDLPQLGGKPIWLAVQEDLGINLGTLMEKL